MNSVLVLGDWTDRFQEVLMVKHVMIIDDSPADQFYAQAIISAMDVDVKIDQAYDGIEGLELLDAMATPPDLIFLDVNMPRMNGHEFLESYDKVKDTGTVIVMLTSSDQTSDREQAFKYDCIKDYLVKPMLADKLKELFSEIS